MKIPSRKKISIPSVIAIVAFVLVATLIGVKEAPFIHHQTDATDNSSGEKSSANSRIPATNTFAPSQDATYTVSIDKDNPVRPVISILLKDESVYTLDFNLIAEAISNGFSLPSLYTANTDVPGLSFSFSPSGQLTDCWSNPIGGPMGKQNATYTVYQISGGMHRNTAFEATGTFQIQAGRTFDIADDNPFKNSPTLQQFGQWYATLPLKKIISDYAAGSPVSYTFTSQALTLNDLGKPGVHATFLDCSGGAVKQVSLADFKSYAQLNPDPKSQGKTYFTLAPYYNQTDMPSGIWSQSSATGTTNNLLVANNFIVLMMNQ